MIFVCLIVYCEIDNLWKSLLSGILLSFLQQFSIVNLQLAIKSGNAPVVIVILVLF